MSFGQNPTTSTQPAPPTNQIFLSSVAVPGTANGDLTALEGGPISTDSNSNKTAPASMYVKDGSDLAQGATTDVAVVGDNPGSLSAKLRGLSKIFNDVWDSVNHLLGVKATQNGTWTVTTTQATGTNLHTVVDSGSVSVSNFPATQPVSATSLPLPGGASTAAKQPAIGTAGSASADVLSVQGIASMTPLKTDGSGITQPVSGSVAVSNFPGTQPVSGTVTANIGTAGSLALESGGNLAAANTHLAAIDTHTPALGQAAMAASVPVTLASNQTAVPIAGNPTSTAALTSVAGAAISTALLAANTSRKTYSVYNDSSANMYLAFGATASTTAYTVKLPPNALYESPGNPDWQGAVSAIWDSATGNARITEVS